MKKRSRLVLFSALLLIVFFFVFNYKSTLTIQEAVLIYCDFDRNIIGVVQDSGKIKQFILENDSEAFSYITKFL